MSTRPDFLRNGGQVFCVYTILAVLSTRAPRVEKGSNRRWRITVEPEDGTGDDIALTLPATTDCAAAKAICTEDGRTLSNAVTASVPRDAPSETPVTPLTVRFEDVPAEHAGEAFGFEVRFSESFKVSYLTMRDHALAVTGGRVTGARRRDNPHHEADGMEANRVWRITLEPDGNGDVQVELPATADCAVTNAICRRRAGARRGPAPHGAVVERGAAQMGGVAAVPGLGLSNGHREYTLGWRLNLFRGGPVSMELGLEATRREAANDDGAEEPVHALMLCGAMRW